MYFFGIAQYFISMKFYKLKVPGTGLQMFLSFSKHTTVLYLILTDSSDNLQYDSIIGAKARLYCYM